VTIDQRLPALRALRRQLQSDFDAAHHIVEGAIANGRDATGLVLRQQEINAQLLELDYVIDYHASLMERDSKIAITRHTLIAATLLYVLLMIPILWLLFVTGR
jgi:phosphate uptake regulator